MAPSFLNLPAEVRNRIYYEYYLVNDGYAYDFRSNKLLEASTGRPIDVALASACTQIYRETLGIPFSLNKITFTAVDATQSKNYSHRCFLAHNGLHMMTEKMFVDCIRCEYVDGTRSWFSLPDSIKETLAIEFPRFKDLFATDAPDGFRAVEMRWSLPHTAWLRLATRGAQLLLEHYGTEEFLKGVKKLSVPLNQYMSDDDILESFHTHWDPWLVPTLEELKRVEKLLWGASKGKAYRTRTESLDDSELGGAFTPANMAVRFLGSLSMGTRQRLRNICLADDADLVFGESKEGHVQGLIPFCRENPHLRVDCIVNILTVAFCFEKPEIVGGSLPEADDLFYRGIEAVKDISAYMAEAFELENQGMPPGAFTLTFDGSPNPDFCAQVFRETAQKMLVERLRLEKEHTSQVQNRLTRLELRMDPHYSMDDFPQGMRELFDGTGILRRNFDMDKPPAQDPALRPE